MGHGAVAMTCVALLVYGLVARRLERTILTGPLLFAGFGFIAGAGGFDVLGIDVEHGATHVIAELTLILVLFTDAARIDLDRVRRDHGLPTRMLSIGLPLTIGAGVLAAVAIFPAWSIWEAALLAALLAPTDAALGQSVVSASAVPIRIRQAINIESGLNDGVALPAVLLFATLAGAPIAIADGAGDWLRFGLMQVTLGPLAGAIVGVAGARLIDAADARRQTTSAFEGIGILALSVLAYSVAEWIGGNGFIAAFVGGLAFGNKVGRPAPFLFAFMEGEGMLLTLLTFAIFGAVLLPEALAHVEPAFVVYAALSLTVVRMVPILVSLFGSRVRLPTALFLGWFGPRGLASILFVLLIVGKRDVPHATALFSITVLTVAMSVVLHGVTAYPLAVVYGRFAARAGDAEAMRSVSELPLRGDRRATDRDAPE